LKNEENGEGASNSLFTKEEIEAEDRKPKRKVAVMIGYAGTGYKGMQINALEKTIEGDLFDAFVKAGAISKANADDPKKSSLVRCARTDKGVHAAGNVISLKLIVEDPNIVQAINEHLPPQIRVWGMERTNGSFSCYQTCDSRWYEYLIPTFALLPPHPQSYLGMKLLESADKEDVLETWKAGQADAASFWDDTEEKYIKPILDKLEPELRTSVLAVINSTVGPPNKAAAGDNIQTRDGTSKRKRDAGEEADDSGAKKIKAQPNDTEEVDDTRPNNIMEEPGEEEKLSEPQPETSIMKVEGVEAPEETASSKSVLTPLDVAVKEVKAAYIAAKKAYRISDQRRSRVQETLDAYLGTRNFHNYTIQKRFSDPSAKRVIRSFNVGKDPVIINDTEWLSLKVHGQSFMMHQIRKMIAMAAMVVRCGTPLSIIQESYGPSTISIPKAPGLGLLLERPVFETYNERASKEFSREKIDFDKYKTEMEAFKQREIYDRIFREEERDHQ
jgi:tRNA pseudouridine38-40 synthase